MGQITTSRFRALLLSLVAISLFTSLLTSLPNALADGALGTPTDAGASSGAGGGAGGGGGAAASFTITYNGNGNTGGSVPAPTVGSGSVTLATNSGLLFKSSNDFSGWNTQADGLGTGYAAGLSSFNLSTNLTLYAKWIPRTDFFTITYDANGSTGGAVPPLKIGTGVVTLDTNTGLLEKTNSTFIGWNTQANGLGTDFAAGLTSYNLNANITLYAKWSPKIEIFTITYDANGSTGGAVPSPMFGNGSVTLAVNSGLLVKTGSGFIGWNTQPDGLGVDYSIGYASYNLNADVTLYAKWLHKIISKYTITYSGIGKTGGSVPSPTVGFGLVTLRGNSGLLVKAGSIFAGWSTHANGSSPNYPPSYPNYMLSFNTILYAKWIPKIVSFTITYNGNGKTGGSVPAPTVGAGSVTLRMNTGLLVKSGATFDGWSTQTNGTSGNFAVGFHPYSLTTNTILYAKWLPIPCALGGICTVGDTGPGGGKVFYVSQSAFTSGGSVCATSCHYLEAAPSGWSGSTVDPAAGWSNNINSGNSVTGTSTTIGAGLVNSILILIQGNTFNTAASKARAYSGGGKTDWYLPTIDELEIMLANQGIIGGIIVNAYYWSSSQFSSGDGWELNFEPTSSSYPFWTYKAAQNRIRPVRAF